MFLTPPQKRVLAIRLRKIVIVIFLGLSLFLYAQPANYYTSASGLKGSALKAQLNLIIENHTEFTYTSSSTDVWDILKQTDKDPNNASNIILLYSGRSVNAAQEYNNASGWNREHVWAKSRGDFGTDLGAGTDVHHLRPEDVGVNSTRSNRSFDNCNTCVTVMDEGVDTGSKYDSNVFTFEPRDAVKGDVARMIFYMVVRYEGGNGEPDLELTENIPSNTDKSQFHGKLSTLIAWHNADPVDDWERNRNDIIYNDYQHNRNPFIDYPVLVDYLWGTKTNEIWDESVTLSINKLNQLQFTVYPNPVDTGKIFINTKGNESKNIIIYDVVGKQIYNKTTVNNTIDVSSFRSGIYFIKIVQNNKTGTIKLIIK